jgi:cell shape-determining protein MreC
VLPQVDEATVERYQILREQTQENQRLKEENHSLRDENRRVRDILTM